jgi:hypothetical protein
MSASSPASKIRALFYFRDAQSRQPGLPMKPGRAGTMTHDYKRHGTTTLFAALNVLDGTVIGHNMQHHRHQEFIRFLNVGKSFGEGHFCLESEGAMDSSP